MSDEILKLLRVLYVEDDDSQRKELGDFFSRRVEKVYIAKNGEEGLEKFRKCQPNVIVCDLRMPKMDGLTMTAKIREMNRTVPIVILTALSDKETILEGVDLNITNYLIKPVELKKLRTVLIEVAKGLTEAGNISFREFFSGEKLNDLKIELIKYVKNNTGKGPNEVSVRVHDGHIVITVFGSLTTFEKSHLTYERNRNMVNYSRDQFYRDRSVDFEGLIRELLGVENRLIKVVTQGELDETELSFLIVE